MSEATFSEISSDGVSMGARSVGVCFGSVLVAGTDCGSSGADSVLPFACVKVCALCAAGCATLVW